MLEQTGWRSPQGLRHFLWSDAHAVVGLQVTIAYVATVTSEDPRGGMFGYLYIAMRLRLFIARILIDLRPAPGFLLFCQKE